MAEWKSMDRAPKDRVVRLRNSVMTDQNPNAFIRARWVPPRPGYWVSEATSYGDKPWEHYYSGNMVVPDEWTEDE